MSTCVEVTVIVEDGLVQCVYANDEKVKVSVLDMDTDQPEVCAELEKNMMEVQARIDTGELHQIY